MRVREVHLVDGVPIRFRDRLLGYLALTKPRVIELLLVTTIPAMLLAGRGTVDLPLILNTLFGGLLAAAGANTLNCVADADIDKKMKRTERRPLARATVPRSHALVFGLALSVASFFWLWWTTNMLSAHLAGATIAFYVLVYTLLLKRRTPQNIVIGGAAGAFPPVIGWAAATGTAPWQAWLLFAIIFLWTPPHSWALALYSAGDYARAGIPMMPVARGAKSTRLQILVYSLVFVPVAVAPGLVGLGGYLYVAVSAIGGLGFLFLAVRLWRSRAGDQPDKAEAVGREAALYDVRAEAKPARNLFAFSILYLMALFAALLVESIAAVPGL